jgi:site-specific recombinase XerD
LRWQLLGAEGEPVADAERFLHAIMLRGLSPRTARTYAYDLLCAYRWMNECALQPHQITGEGMLGFIEYQQRPPPAEPSTINRRLRLLQRLVGSLTGTAPMIPAWQHQAHALVFHTRSRHGSLRLKQPHRVVHPLKDAEVLEFFGSLKTWRDRAMVLLMWAEGLRSAEVLDIEFSQIDFCGASLRVQGKGRKERLMPLAEAVVKALLLYVRLERPASSSQKLFVVLKGPRRGRPLSPEGLRRLFRYHRSSSGVAHANAHRFRHTFGANMTRGGVPLLVLARMMGHSSPQTTMRYVEFEDQELRTYFLEALETLRTKGLLDERIS